MKRIMGKKSIGLVMFSSIFLSGCGQSQREYQEGNVISVNSKLVFNHKENNVQVLAGGCGTRQIIRNTNELINAERNVQPMISFDGDVYKDSLKKISSTRLEYDSYENKQKYALKTASFVTDRVFDAATAATDGAGALIFEPMKEVKNQAFAAAIENTKREHETAVGDMLYLLSRDTSSVYQDIIRQGYATADQTKQFLDETYDKARKELSSADFEKFKSAFGSEVTESTLLTILDKAKSSEQSIDEMGKTVSDQIKDQTKKVVQTGKKVDDLISATGNFAENTKNALDNVESVLAKNTANSETSLTKLGVIERMIFENSTPAQKEKFIKSDEFKVIFPKEEDRKKIEAAVKFTNIAQDSLTVISRLNTIGTNLDILGKDGGRVLNIASVSISAAMSFYNPDPISMLNGIAGLTGLFSKKREDPTQVAIQQMFKQMMLNHKEVMEKLEKLSQQIEGLRQEVNARFDALTDEIYLSRKIQMYGEYNRLFENCRLVKVALGKNLIDYKTIVTFLSDYHNSDRVAGCTDNLHKMFLEKFNNSDEDVFSGNTLKFFRFDFNAQSENVKDYSKTYKNILDNLKDSNVKLSSEEFDYNVLIHPEMVVKSTTDLLNNSFWFDLLVLNPSYNTPDKSLVAWSSIEKNISANNTAVVLLENALWLLDRVIEQQLIWSGIVGLDQLLEQFVKIKPEEARAISCSEDKYKTNVLCLMKENKYLSMNILNALVQKKLGKKVELFLFKADGKKASTYNNPSYLNYNLKDVTFKFVWIGDGADPGFDGEIIADANIVKALGSGIFFKYFIGKDSYFIPLLSIDDVKEKRAFAMPVISNLNHIKAKIVDELIERRIPSILNDKELIQFNNSF